METTYTITARTISDNSMKNSTKWTVRAGCPIYASSPPGQPLFDKLRSTPTAAYGNAPAAHGDFPLVLYSGGKASRADDNVELGEYLASYGYVVATVPQLGPSDHELELGSSPPEISPSQVQRRQVRKNIEYRIIY